MSRGAVEIPHGPSSVRWRRFGLALLFLGLAGVFAFAVQRTTTFECDRAGKGECVLASDGLGHRPRAFPISAIRDVEFHEYRTKGGKKGGVELIDTRGHAFRLGERPLDVARVEHRAIAEFFAEGGPPTLYVQMRPSPWGWLIVVLLGISGVGLLRSALSDLAARGTEGRSTSEEPVSSPEPAPVPSTPTRQFPGVLKFFLVVLAVGVVGSIAFEHFATRGQGTLELQCVHRCRMGGMTCLPGGASRMSLDPGVYTIEVWNPDLEAQWANKTFEVKADETTVFECRP